MIALLKAIPFGLFLTLLVALFMGSGGATGGMLGVRPVDIDIDVLNLDFRMYWSWILFLGGTALAWALLLMIGD